MRTVKAWADIGSHGWIFAFGAGPVASRYPNLMHVFAEPHQGLIPVKITYEWPRPKKTKEGKK